VLKLEIIIGLSLIAVGIGPVSWVILAGGLPPPTCYPPEWLLESCGATGSRVQTQFTYFWFLISFFFLGIGTWLTIAGLKSRAVLSKAKPT
jgi:hypothetical protein